MIVTPKRIQRKRAKGWRMPDGAKYVGRPTKWANPWRVTDTITADQAVEHYKAQLRHEPSDFFAPLLGKDLACWCAIGQPCHADALLEEIARRWGNKCN